MTVDTLTKTETRYNRGAILKPFADYLPDPGKFFPVYVPLHLAH